MFYLKLVLLIVGSCGYRCCQLPEHLSHRSQSSSSCINMASPQRKPMTKTLRRRPWRSGSSLSRQRRHSGKVLVVEDEPEILEPLAHSLQKAGFTVLRAEDGLTACRLIGSERPDLVLLDIMLPDLDGWEVCRLLRQHPDPLVANTPVIMLTALDAAEDKYRGLEIGADLFLPKPYSIREVILHAGNLVRRTQQTLTLEDRVEGIVKEQTERTGHPSPAVPRAAQPAADPQRLHRTAAQRPGQHARRPLHGRDLPQLELPADAWPKRCC